MGMRLSITHPVKVALAIGAASLGIAACGGGDDEESASAASASGGSGIVSIASVDGTDVLADSGGRTLYTAEVEKDGNILCVDACTSFWEPVLASPDQAESAATDIDADLGVVDRPDGDRQLTFNGLPLYTFTEEDAGQLEGDGFVDDFQGTHFEWAAATTGSGSGSSGSEPPSDSSDGGYGY
jgi:predicted lipoprotein with Yx(FWY)xxD motif